MTVDSEKEFECFFLDQKRMNSYFPKDKSKIRIIIIKKMATERKIIQLGLLRSTDGSIVRRQYLQEPAVD